MPAGKAAGVRARPLALLLLLLPACGGAVDTAVKARDCAALAKDVAATGLGQVPSRAQAEEAVRRLDRRVEDLDDPEVKEAASTLRDRLQDLVDAAQRGDAARVTSAAAAARAAAQAAADSCGLPVGQFL